MTYRISKRWTFDAAHRLPDLPDGHKCSRLHGHTYTVEVVLAADDLDPAGPGFVVDFAAMGPVGRHLDAMFDHRYLNDCVPFPPTCERLAQYIYCWCHTNLSRPDGVTVEVARVSETPSTWAEYRP